MAAVLLRRLFGSRLGLTRLVEVLGLVACCAVGTLISACFGPASLRLGGVIDANELGKVWRTWWLSDLSGALIVTPVLLTWAVRAAARGWAAARRSRRPCSSSRWCCWSSCPTSATSPTSSSRS